MYFHCTNEYKGYGLFDPKQVGDFKRYHEENHATTPNIIE